MLDEYGEREADSAPINTFFQSGVGLSDQVPR